MKIEIEWLSDSYDCDDCGMSWAEGAIVFFNGVKVLDLTPSAHCYDGINYERDEVYRQILAELGHTVEER